jgi:cytochrome c oxidase subunit IV
MATTLEDHAIHHEAHENRDKKYVVIALVLAALTLLEVSTYVFPDAFGGKGHWAATVVLLVLMAVKFWTVAWFFMHLKFDKRVLTVVFYSGLVLAGLVYLAVITAFRFWGPSHDHMVPNAGTPK